MGFHFAGNVFQNIDRSVLDFGKFFVLNLLLDELDGVHQGLVCKLDIIEEFQLQLLIFGIFHGVTEQIDRDQPEDIKFIKVLLIDETGELRLFLTIEKGILDYGTAQLEILVQ